MPQPDDLAVALARLGALAPGSDVNIKPVLLQVAVDLFVQQDVHTPDDLRTFEAMVGPLLDLADPETRRAVAQRLTEHPGTPHALLDRLVDERMLAAARMFRHAPIEEADLLAAAERGPVTVAVMIAHRRALSEPVVTALAQRREPLVAMALAANREAPLGKTILLDLVGRARRDAGLAERLAGRALDPMDIAPLFPLLGPDARRGIIEAVRRMELGRRDWGRPDVATADILAQLDGFVLSGEWDGFNQVLCGTLAYEEATLRPLLHDGTGDILALALAAVGARGEMAARAFILGDPVIGRSVAAVRRLTGLVDAIAPPAARRLIGSMMAGAEQGLRRVMPSTLAAPTTRGRAESALGEPMPTRRAAVDTAQRRRL